MPAHERDKIAGFDIRVWTHTRSKQEINRVAMMVPKSAASAHRTSSLSNVGGALVVVRLEEESARPGLPLTGSSAALMWPTHERNGPEAVRDRGARSAALPLLRSLVIVSGTFLRRIIRSCG